MKTILLLLLSFAVATGCKKSPPTETAPQDGPAASTTPSAPTNQPAAPAPAATTVDTTKAFADANSALKVKDYQKATETLLMLQRQPQLTDQQSMALRGQMVQLQSAVAAGVAKGDANAKAAADQLRAQASGN